VRRAVALASARSVPGFIPLTQAAFRLRSAGAHFVPRAVALASARSVLRISGYHNDCSGSENGPPKVDKLFNQKNKST